MKTFCCGRIKQDDVMSHCIINNIVLQHDIFELGYNWAINKIKNYYDIASDNIYSNIELFFYGIRVSICENKLTENDIKIIYQCDIDNIFTYLNIPFNSNGHIEHWPDGFFDEEQIALTRLFKSQRNIK